MRFSIIFAALFYCSQNKGFLKREERLSDFKERCAQLCCKYKYVYSLRINYQEVKNLVELCSHFANTVPTYLPT